LTGYEDVALVRRANVLGAVLDLKPASAKLILRFTAQCTAHALAAEAEIAQAIAELVAQHDLGPIDVETIVAVIRALERGEDIGTPPPGMAKSTWKKRRETVLDKTGAVGMKELAFEIACAALRIARTPPLELLVSPQAS
jgi:hypothetical protein